MAENRVTETHLEIGIQRNSVPGNARMTETHLEVAMLKDIVPGALARVTSTYLEVALLRSSGAQPRSWGFIII